MTNCGRMVRDSAMVTVLGRLFQNAVPSVTPTTSLHQNWVPSEPQDKLRNVWCHLANMTENVDKLWAERCRHLPNNVGPCLYGLLSHYWNKITFICKSEATYVALQHATNAFAAGALPRTPLGSLQRFPGSLVSWGRGASPPNPRARICSDKFGLKCAG